MYQIYGLLVLLRFCGESRFGLRFQRKKKIGGIDCLISQADEVWRKPITAVSVYAGQ